ncbi:hypothetical protein V5O48_018979, partial [Marasmius crinis-equi]
VYPPFNKVYLRPGPANKVFRQLAFEVQGNREAYCTLFLQCFILNNYENKSLANEIVQLDPEQFNIYLIPSPNDLIHPAWFSSQVKTYAHTIAEIGLSIAMACKPSAPKAWIDTVFMQQPCSFSTHHRAPYQLQHPSYILSKLPYVHQHSLSILNVLRLYSAISKTTARPYLPTFRSPIVTNLLQPPMKINYGASDII